MVITKEIKEKAEKKIPLWYKEKRLPTDEEIKQGQGWPDSEQEEFLRETFIKEYIPKFRKYLRDKKESLEDQRILTEVSDNQVEQVVAFLYGIYFYNLITGGEIITHHLSYAYYRLASDKAKMLGFDKPDNFKATVPLSTEVLEEWPIGVLSPVLMSKDALASADIYSKKINIYLDRFKDRDPSKISKLIVRQGYLSGFGPGQLAYKSSGTNEWIRSGIEEAQHLHFAYLRERRKNYQSTKGDSGYIAIGEIIDDGPIIDLITRDEYSETKFDDARNRLIRYNSLLGNEFAAHVVQAVYTKKYDQLAWNSGYERYDQLIRESRKKALSKRKRDNN